jgi:uncharacterized protein (TIGR02001 family)
MLNCCSRWKSSTAWVLAGLAAPLAAQAQMGAAIAVDSDYRVRGVPLADSGPTLRATLNYDAPGGWYLGVMAAHVELAKGDRYAQVIPYAGHVWRVDEWRRVELGATYSHFTGDTRYDYGEGYVGLLADGWNARAFFAPDYFGRGVRTAYAEFNAHAALSALSRLFGHVGVLVPVGHAEAEAKQTRFDIRAGAGMSIGDIDLQLARVAISHRGGPYPAVYAGRRAAWVASVTLAF